MGAYHHHGPARPIEDTASEHARGTMAPRAVGDRTYQPGPARSRVLREALVILLGALLYFLVRGLMQTRVALAQANAEALVDLEQALGLQHEGWFQSLIVGSGWKVDLANRVYIFGHWPVIIGTFCWLIWRHSHAFATYRTALLISGAIGLVCFVLIPMAPPRLLADGAFVDTVTQRSEAYRVLQPPAFTNQYAAMPSLHVGWNLLMGIAIVRHASTRWTRWFGYVMPLVMYLSTIVTANHYLLDGVVGSIVALIGLALAWRIHHRCRVNAANVLHHVALPPASRTATSRRFPAPVRTMPRTQDDRPMTEASWRAQLARIAPDPGMRYRRPARRAHR